MKPNPEDVNGLDLTLFSFLEWRDGEGSSVNSDSHLSVRAGRRPTRTSGVGNGGSREDK